MRRVERGFTLIELVVGITAFAIVITLVTGLIVPQATRSVDPIFQVRATELAQGLINEINAKAFDDASDNSSGGFIRCGQSVAAQLGIPESDLPANLPPLISCTAPNALRPELVNPLQPNSPLEQRDDFDDVDDFNNLVANGSDIVNSLGETLSLGNEQLYDGFQVQVNVFYDGNLDGQPDAAAGDTKLIRVTVTTPNNESLLFSSYRMNF